ncbi:hypothetical protein [Vibrio sonorensis]|uniref:hypothetical protein n=1 Tax=Vibrio sonorensis TaxID=1004316 RepID=UPI0008DB0EC7|nr:hypothetical protein [Vibrio sonorensis]
MLETSKAELATQNQRIAKQASQIESERQKYVQLASDIEGLEAMIEQQNQQIDARVKLVEQLDTKIKANELLLEEKNQTIGNQKRTLSMFAIAVLLAISLVVVTLLSYRAKKRAHTQLKIAASFIRKKCNRTHQSQRRC